MKAKKPGEILDSYVPELPDRFYSRVFRLLLRCLALGKSVKYTYHFDVKQMKGKRVLLLADHSSTDNYIYAALGWPFAQPNVIMGYQNILQGGVFRLLLKVGVIPKKLYIPDVSTARSIVRLNKKGASFLLFPEGIQSMAGSTMPMNPATMQLVKRLGLPVILVKSFGAYLNRPRFDPSYRHGPMEFSYEMLFTEGELAEKTEDELYKKYLERFRYNDFAWNREKRYSYKGKHRTAYGLDKILFVCPKCGREFSMRVEEDQLVCGCGNTIKVDEKYELTAVGDSVLPYRGVDEWFLRQRGLVLKEASREGFTFSYPAEYLTLDYERLGNDRCVRLGEGRVTIDRELFRYDGTKSGEMVTISIPISGIPSAPFVSGTANEFFYGKDYYRFVPKDDPRLSVKILLLIEELHNLSDPVWAKVSKDVYH